MIASLEVEPDGDAETGRCACCGQVSRKLWGYVRQDRRLYAAYFVHWTAGHVADHGAHIDLILGRWGDGAAAADRYAVSLEYRILDSGPALMVIDSGERDIARSELAGNALNRADVIGGPLAENVFAVCDAVLVHDPRLAEL